MRKSRVCVELLRVEEPLIKQLLKYELLYKNFKLSFFICIYVSVNSTWLFVFVFHHNRK